MYIDISFLLVLIFAFFIGFRKGIIHSFLSVLALFVGIIAALKFSNLAAALVEQWFHADQKFIPFISFLLVFIAVIVGMWFLSKILETMISMTGLGIANKISGAIVWVIVSVFVFSTLLFYADKMNWISQKQKENSKTFNRLQPLAPLVIEQIGSAIPFLEGTFDRIASHMEQKENPEPNPENKEE